MITATTATEKDSAMEDVPIMPTVSMDSVSVTMASQKGWEAATDQIRFPLQEI